MIVFYLLWKLSGKNVLCCESIKNVVLGSDPETCFGGGAGTARRRFLFL